MVLDRSTHHMDRAYTALRALHAENMRLREALHNIASGAVAAETMQAIVESDWHTAFITLQHMARAAIAKTTEQADV